MERRGADQLARPFVGVDGEGGNDATGYHAYFLLTAGNRSIRPSAGNIRLTTLECLAFIAGLDPSCIYVGYYFDYDVTKILEDLSWRKLERLMDRKSRERRDGKGVFPVSYAGYDIDYLPKKEFKVRNSMGGPWIRINDVGSFFQCRFVEALEKWRIGTPEELDAIGRGKEQRANFTVNDIDEIAPYNALEIVLLQQLMTKFREACNQIGYLPARWQGPGQLAEAAFSKHGVTRSKDVPIFNDDKYESLLRYGLNAFYGGRPEIMAVGPVDRPVYQYDINSAYPFAMLHVPCMLHGHWRFYDWTSSIRGRTKVQQEAEYAIYCGTFSALPNTQNYRQPMFYGLPVRSADGSICYPANGGGWYWNFEIDASIHQRFVAESGWVYYRSCDCRPLAFVEELYRQRQLLGKDDAGIVVKLILNSLYGKRVQSIGSPKYADPVTGSFITAWCRKMIQEFIHSSPLCREKGRWCGRDVLMVATDSVATWQKRDDIVLSKELGDWSCDEHPRGMFLVQPGLYFGSSGKAVKTRGVPRSVMENMEGDFREAFERMCLSHVLSDGDVTVPQRMFVGIRYALQRRNIKLLGQWVEFSDPETGRNGKTIKFDWTSKRAGYPVMDPVPGAHSYLETFPKQGSTEIRSVPYSKDIGGLVLRESLRLLMEDQPDWMPAIEPTNLRDV